MKIRKVRYAKPTPGKTERHCAAFLTESGEVIVVGSVVDNRGTWPIFNSRDAVRLASDIMGGKKKRLRIAPILPLGLLLTVAASETTKYDETLVAMAKAGQLVNAIVIENIPDSIEELQRFAVNALREPVT